MFLFIHLQGIKYLTAIYTPGLFIFCLCSFFNLLKMHATMLYLRENVLTYYTFLPR